MTAGKSSILNFSRQGSKELPPCPPELGHMEWALQGCWFPILPGTGGFRDLGTYLLADGLLAAVCHLLEPSGKLHLWKEKVKSEKTHESLGFPWWNPISF